MKPFRFVLPLISHRHEHLGSTGFPEHMHGEGVPLAARILETVDAYDALSTERPYRKALPDDEALRVMRQEGKCGWGDPRLVEEFAAMSKEGKTREAALDSAYSASD